MSDPAPASETELALWERELLDLFVGIFEAFGMPKSMAMIYGILYCADEPLLQDDISRKLGISTGSASQGLKVLNSLGAVHRQSPVGQRQSVYTAERSVRRLVSTFIDTQFRPKLSLGRERLEDILSSIPEEDTSARQKIETLMSWQKKSERALPLVTGLLGK